MFCPRCGSSVALFNFFGGESVEEGGRRPMVGVNVCFYFFFFFFFFFGWGVCSLGGEGGKGVRGERGRCVMFLLTNFFWCVGEDDRGH